VIKHAAVLLGFLLPATAWAAPVHHQLQRPDGTQIDYSVDAPEGPSAGMVVLLTGSGCLPGVVNANIALARAAFPEHTALIVEKSGVRPDAAATDGFTDCPAAFHAGHTVSQRVEDTVAVIEHLGPADRLVLFGGSEGGLAVALLAGRVQADAAIILSSGMGMAFDHLVLSTVPPEGHSQVSAGFAAARADPQGHTLFAGSSHRFWADILPLLGVDAMLQSDTPFLLIQGGMDRSSPLKAARMTADRFTAEGRCNLTYWELPALDHGMKDAGGASSMEGVLVLAATWAANPLPAC
jgi:pimeloyl-ACP methyl ester carboxylesterase